MSETGELGFKFPAPEVSPAEVDCVCHLLANPPERTAEQLAKGRVAGWMTAEEIEAAIGIGDRKLRKIAEHSDGRILSGPGCPGYRLFTGEISLSDADACATRIESQAKRMLNRAAAIRRRFHRYARR